MSREASTLETTRQIVAEVLELQSEQIGDDLDLLADLGVDSLSALQILDLIEQKFAIDLSFESLTSWQTVQSIAASIEKELEVVGETDD